MSSLWTPGGEHRVPREPSEPAGREGEEEGAGPADLSDLPGYDELTPDQREQAEALARELTEARQRIAETPASEVVANHVMGLYELAAIHLSGQPPALAEAQVAIDAMAAVVTALPGRLGVNEKTLRDALQQLQMAFVQLKAADEAGAEEPRAQGGPEPDGGDAEDTTDATGAGDPAD